MERFSVLFIGTKVFGGAIAGNICVDGRLMVVVKKAYRYLRLKLFKVDKGLQGFLSYRKTLGAQN